MSTIRRLPPMNPLQPRGINKLHLETLLDIIKLATTDFDCEGHRIPPSRLLAKLSRVCSRWHTAIRGDPRLWTTICGTEQPPMIEGILDRTGRMPLVVYGDFGRDVVVSRYGAEMLLPQIHRMTVFRICVDIWEIDALLPLLDTDAPLLESFKLEVRYAYNMTIDLFGGRIPPRLAHLSLKGCTVSWSSPILRNLTSLTLKGGNRCGVHTFVDALSQMSSLEKLVLDTCLPEDFYNSANRDVEISLPRVTHLHVADYMPRCTAFLKQTKCQPTRLIVPAYLYDPQDNDEVFDDFAELFDACKNMLSPFIKTTTLTHFEIETGLRHLLLSASRPDGESAPVPKKVLTLSLDVHEPEGTPPLITDGNDLIALALNVVPVHEVEHLICWLYHDIHPQFWTQIVSAKFPQLRHLSTNWEIFDSVKEMVLREHSKLHEQEQKGGDGIAQIPKALSFPNLMSLSGSMLRSCLYQHVMHLPVFRGQAFHLVTIEGDALRAAHTVVGDCADVK